jgi:uncharacterized delta-60 repeat protein
MLLASAAFTMRGEVSAMVVDPVDPTFGIVITEIPRAPNGATARLARMAVAPGGRVLVLVKQEERQPDGTYCNSSAMLAYTPDGQPDTAFGAGGRASPEMMGLPHCVSPLDFAIANTGGIYILAASSGPRLWKTTDDGRSDRTFVEEGSTPLPPLQPLEAQIRILDDGRIAIGGLMRLTKADGATYEALGVVMLRSDGTLDRSYGSQGVAIALPPSRTVYARGSGFAVTTDGSALVAGNIFDRVVASWDYTNVAVARFTPGGQLDATYGSNGFAWPLPGVTAYVQWLVVADGKPLLAGVKDPGDTLRAYVMRLTTEGNLDTSFGDGGLTVTDRFKNSETHGQIVVDASGRIYQTFGDWHYRPRIVRYDRNGRADPTFGVDGSAFVAAQDWNMASYAYFTLGPDDRPYLGVGAFAFGSDEQRTAIGVTRIKESGGHREGLAAGHVWVYIHYGLNHYFMTADPVEQAKLDAGIIAGWHRTGDFWVVTSNDPVEELSPVCRFYGRPEAKLDSHFFSAAPDECEAVLQRFSASWLLESANVFQVHLPDRATGACPRGSEKIFRAFNNRADANHYYGLLAVAPYGWTYEGYGPGPYPTAFCAPLV